MKNILVVDDHPLFQEGFAHMVKTLRPDWTLHFADTAERALNKLRELSPDLLIIDVGLPGDDGFALLKAATALFPLIGQVIISGRDDAAVRMRARASGARSFIAKTESPQAIATKIDAVLTGNTVFDADTEVNDLPKLTERQSEILMLLAAGLSNKEIRHRLNIAERTVRAHLTELFNLLGAHSRMHAIVRAREMGLLA